MDERIDRYLDGELPAARLTPEERARADRFEARVQEVRRALDQEAPEGIEARVMERIEALPELRAAPSLPSWLAALVQPREVRIRPVYALAAAAVVALLSLAPWRQPVPAPAVEQAAQAPIYVQFRIQVDAAESVALAGSFTGWQPSQPLQQTADGVWTVVLPITPGVHDYVFVIDGQRWVPDPYAPQVDDGFGGTNSRLTLLAPAAL